LPTGKIGGLYINQTKEEWEPGEGEKDWGRCPFMGTFLDCNHGGKSGIVHTEEKVEKLRRML